MDWFYYFQFVFWKDEMGSVFDQIADVIILPETRSAEETGSL